MLGSPSEADDPVQDGDLDAVIAVLAPDVIRRADRAALPSGRPTEVHGARTVADEIVVLDGMRGSPSRR